MTRAQALPRLSKWLDLADELGATLDDTDESIGSVFDSALRDLGTEEADLTTVDVASASIPAFLALLDYYLLDHLIPFAIRVDSVIGDNSNKESQYLSQILKAQELAAKKAKGLGYLGSDFVLGEIGLNYLEPDTSEV